ncbi:hypothetical protein [Streptomyces sp. NPDC048172]|uniref:hypothetical protein n=1 Tax=Streptomyces sp. NPDC048172 TaxID=3365505 RepID=UPI003713E510
MPAIPTEAENGPKAPRGGRYVRVLGVVAAVVLAAAVAGGAYVWQQRDGASQASAADCALAQKIVDQAGQLPEDKDEDAVTKWQKDTQDLRRSKMEDGYLGLQIAKYEGWAVAHARGEGAAPSEAKQKETADTANSHCADADRTLRFPPIGS